MNPSQFKTIVTGVDFSNYSKIVVNQSLKLAAETGASLVFVYSLSTNDFIYGEVPSVNLEKEFIEPLTQEVISFYKLSERAPKAEVIIKIGQASDQIISVACSFKQSLIVVGHKGAGSLLGRFFLGSTAEAVALRSPFPVWIHRGNTVLSPKKILLPCDYSKRTTDCIKAVRSLYSPTDSKYEFFHAVQNPLPFLDAAQWKKSMAALRKKESAKQKEFHTLYPDVPLKKKLGEAAPLIIEESKKFDLIAMASHNREGLFSTFGSVTAKVVRSGNTPVLITH